MFVFRKDYKDLKTMVDWVLKELEYSLENDVLKKLPTKKHEKVICLEIIQLLKSLDIEFNTIDMLIQFAAELIAVDKLLMPNDNESENLISKMKEMYLGYKNVNSEQFVHLSKIIEYCSKNKSASMDAVTASTCERIPQMLRMELDFPQTINSMLSILINAQELIVSNEFIDSIVEKAFYNKQAEEDFQMLVLGLLNNLIEHDLKYMEYLCRMEACGACELVECTCKVARRKTTKSKTHIPPVKISFLTKLVGMIDFELENQTENCNMNGKIIFSCILLVNLVSNNPTLVPMIKNAFRGGSFVSMEEILLDYVDFRTKLHNDGDIDGADKSTQVVRKLVEFLQNNK